MAEYVIAGLIAWSVFVLAPAIHAPDADYFYRTGLIDRYEYERRKGLLKTDIHHGKKPGATAMAKERCDRLDSFCDRTI